MEWFLRVYWKKLILVFLLAGGAAFIALRHGASDAPGSGWTALNGEIGGILSEETPKSPSGTGNSKPEAPSSGKEGSSVQAGSKAGETSPETKPGTAVPASSAQPSGKPGSPGAIDINTATASRLADLPGIGPSKAKAIVAYRETNGPFGSPEELRKVKGIGPKTYEGLKSRITVSP